jgi:hypothetical protein
LLLHQPCFNPGLTAGMQCLPKCPHAAVVPGSAGWLPPGASLGLMSLTRARLQAPGCMVAWPCCCQCMHAVPDPLSGSQSLRIKPPLKIRLGRRLVTCHAQSPIDTLTKRDRTAPVSACMPARWLSKQLIWLADSKRVQGLTGLTRTRSSRVHSYRHLTVCMPTPLHVHTGRHQSCL